MKFYIDKIRACGAVPVLVTPPPRQYYKNGKIEEASEHRPDYLRLSQAEREMLEKQKKEEKIKQFS